MIWVFDVAVSNLIIDDGLGSVRGALTLIHVTRTDVFTPYAFPAPCKIVKLPVVNVAVVFWVVLQLFTVVEFVPCPIADQFHDVGVPVEVSVNCILNGGTPDHPCVVLFVTAEILVDVKEDTGVDVTA